MKTPEELSNALIIATNEAYKTILAEIQKDAYNQALFDLADADLLPDKQKNLIKYMK